MQPVPGTALREETRGEMAGETPEKFGCLNKKMEFGTRAKPFLIEKDRQCAKNTGKTG